jgi:hypothetical protein
VYKDEVGESHTAKGETDGIRRALKEGLLGDATNIVACRQKQGPFLALRSYPEFRDLVIEPEALAPPAVNPRSTPTSVPVPPSGRWPDPNRPAASTPTPGTTPPRSGRMPAPPPDGSSDVHPPLSSKRHPKPDVTASGRLPHFKIEAGRRGGFEVVMWLMVLAIAVGTALGAFYLFPPG